jgi:hypothetical protein
MRAAESLDVARRMRLFSFLASFAKVETQSNRGWQELSSSEHSSVDITSTELPAKSSEARDSSDCAMSSVRTGFSCPLSDVGSGAEFYFVSRAHDANTNQLTRDMFRNQRDNSVCALIIVR